jgi:CHAT domain-containing protein
LTKEVLGEKHPNTLGNLSNLAGIYQDLWRLSEALLLSEKAYRLRKEVLGEKHPDTLTSLINLALIYQIIGRLSEALPLYEKGYRLYKEVLGEKHPETITSLINLAAIYKDLWRLSEALPLFEKGHRLRKEVLGEKHPETFRSLNNLVFIYQATGRLSEALPLYEKGYRLSKEVLGEKHRHTLSSLSNLALIYKDLGQINKAIKHFEKLVKGVEHLRIGDLSAENRQALFKKWVPNYFTLSGLYIGKSRSEDAFRLAELSKARTLLEFLAAKRAAQESGLTKAEQDKLQDYEARLASFNNQIGKALQSNRLDDRVRLEIDKKQLLNKLNKLHGELMAKYPKYAQLSEVQIIGAKEGAPLLPADAVLISYLVNKNQVLAFTLQANGKFTAHDLGEIPNLEKDLRGKARRFKTARQKRKALNKKLTKYLLEPLKDIIKDKPHWIISPSGALALIPFETLRFEGSSQPVIAQHHISYVQSLSVLALLQKREKVYKSLENRGTLLAMGAPFYKNTATNKGNPSTTDYKIARQMVMRGGNYANAFSQLNLTWKELPGALKELKQLKKLFKETKPRIYVKANATEAKLQRINELGILAQYRYLVFSAHGYLSPQVPALSSIVLGQLNNPKGIDGYVTAGEWPGYDLKSDLMMLSACETGLGEVVSREGVMGLPYAFYVAGNKNTILTLWTISDSVTVEFVTSFFERLKAGQIEALTATKREFLKKGGRYSEPAYWAAFVLYGV